jgi:trans-aconitate methyltransferase
MSERINRPWQNWDVGDTAAVIDQYWTGSANEQGSRTTLALDIGATLGRGIPIFEVGCGTGLMGKELIAQGVVTSALYSGGDVSKAMLAIGRKRLPECSLLDLDIFDLTPLGPQDNVICLHVVQHLPHYRDALAQLLRFARKQLYVATWFSAADADEISMSRDSPAEPAFNTNRYGMTGFLAQIQASDRQIASVTHRQVLGETWGVHVTFG